MLARLLLLFTLVPLTELILLLWLGERIGLLPTFGLIVATGTLGAFLARLQGLSAYARFRSALAAGRVPGRELADGVLILVAGAVLLTPGVLTDAVGFALLAPPVRRRVADRLSAWARERFVPGGGSRPDSSRTEPGETLDARFEILDDT